MIQTVSIIAAFPFAFVMIIAMVSLRKSLKNEIIEVPEVSTKEKLKNMLKPSDANAKTDYQ